MARVSFLVRCTDEQKLAIEEAAERGRQPVSVWALEALLRAASGVAGYTSPGHGGTSRASSLVDKHPLDAVAKARVEVKRAAAEKGLPGPVFKGVPEKGVTCGPNCTKLHEHTR